MRRAAAAGNTENSVGRTTKTEHLPETESLPEDTDSRGAAFLHARYGQRKRAQDKTRLPDRRCQHRVARLRSAPFHSRQEIEERYRAGTESFRLMLEGTSAGLTGRTPRRLLSRIHVRF